MPPSFPLMLLAVALAGVISWELAEDRELPPPGPEVATLPAPPTPGTPELPGEDGAGAWARVALARPLFQHDRRAGTVPPSPLAGVEALPRLTALLSGPFGRRAIFAGADGKAMAVEEGAALGGWTVVAIGMEGVSVTGRDGERTVSLGRGSGAQAVIEAPVAPEEVDEHAGGGALTSPKSGPMFLYPGDPPAGRR